MIEPAQTLGDRSRTQHLRFGVISAGVALVYGLYIVESGAARTLAWLIALPLGFAAYGVLAGALGICAMTGLTGRRETDHGPETILDRGCARTIRGKAALLVLTSLVVGSVGAAGFAISL